MGPNPILFRSGPPERPNTIKVTSFPPSRRPFVIRYPASGIRHPGLPPPDVWLSVDAALWVRPRGSEEQGGRLRSQGDLFLRKTKTTPKNVVFLNWRVFVTFVFETYRLGPLLLFRPGAT